MHNYKYEDDLVFSNSNVYPTNRVRTNNDLKNGWHCICLIIGWFSHAIMNLFRAPHYHSVSK